MEKFGLKGKLRVELLDANGFVKDVRDINNLIVNTGKAQVASLLAQDIAGDAFRYTAIGTGSTAPTASDTALVSEYMRESSSQTRITTSVADDTARFETEFTVTSTVTLQESGIFNTSSAGTMLNRATFSALEAVNNDVVKTDWKVQVS